MSQCIGKGKLSSWLSFQEKQNSLSDGREQDDVKNNTNSRNRGSDDAAYKSWHRTFPSFSSDVAQNKANNAKSQSNKGQPATNEIRNKS